jgi:hypothetical protein
MYTSEQSSTYNATSQFGHWYTVSSLFPCFLHTTHLWVLVSFLLEVILLEKCHSVSFAIVLLSSWGLVTLCLLEYFTSKPCTKVILNCKWSTFLSAFYLYIIIIAFSAITFSSVQKSFIYHLLISFISARYVYNRLCFLSMPHINLFYSVTQSWACWLRFVVTGLISPPQNVETATVFFSLHLMTGTVHVRYDKFTSL